MIKHLLLLLISLSALSLAAQMDSLKQQNKFKAIPLPAIAYSPESGLTFGIYLFNSFLLAKENAPCRFSSGKFKALYSTTKLVVVEQDWDVYLPNENYIFRGEVGYRKEPDRNYGLGNRAENVVNRFDSLTGAASFLNNYLEYETQQVGLNMKILRKIFPKFHGGFNIHLQKHFKPKILNEGALFIDPSILQIPFVGRNIGFGINLSYDTRDIPVNPTKGLYIQLDHTNYGKKIGSNFSYTKLTLDSRAYFQTWKEQTIATQLIVDQRFSAQPIPLFGLPQLGGKNLLRGYYQGTFQLNKLMALQFEYRLPVYYFKKKFPLLKGIGFVAYSGIGTVFDEWSDFDLKAIRPSSSLGIRLLIDKEKRVNVGFDFGVGWHKNDLGLKPQKGYYFFLGELF